MGWWICGIPLRISRWPPAGTPKSHHQGHSCLDVSHRNDSHVGRPVSQYRLPPCWYSVFKASGWMSRSQFVWLFGFRYTFPCLGWMQGLPLPYGQIRIINRSNFWAHFDFRERDCNWRILENIHPCSRSNTEGKQRTICLRFKQSERQL